MDKKLNTTTIDLKFGELTIAAIQTGEGRYIVKTWHKITSGKFAGREWTSVNSREYKTANGANQCQTDCVYLQLKCGGTIRA